MLFSISILRLTKLNSTALLTDRLLAMSRDPANTGQEAQQGKRLAKVAQAAGVKAFLWSSLPNAEEASGGKWKVAHFTEKAKVGCSVACRATPGLASLARCTLRACKQSN